MAWNGKGFRGVKFEEVPSVEYGNCNLVKYGSALNIMNIMPMSVAILKPGEGVKPHNHKDNNMHEIYYLMRGKGQIIIDDQKIDVEEGASFYLEPEQERWVKNNTDEECCWLFAGTTKALIEATAAADRAVAS